MLELYNKDTGQHFKYLVGIGKLSEELVIFQNALEFIPAQFFETICVMILQTVSIVEGEPATLKSS